MSECCPAAGTKQQQEGGEIEDLARLCETCGVSVEQCGGVAAGSAAASTGGGEGATSFLERYEQHVRERATAARGLGVAPKPLGAVQVRQLLHELVARTGEGDGAAAAAATLVRLLATRVPPGVDDAAQVKASFLANVALQRLETPHVARERAVQLLGTMQGGYNVAPLIELLQDEDADVAMLAAEQLKRTILVYDAFDQVRTLSEQGCVPATVVLESWAAAEWFLSKPAVPDVMTLTVFKVTGETNTDDLSPGQDAWSRPDIPLHAVTMLKNPRPGLTPVVPGEIGPLRQLQDLKTKTGFPVAYVGDVVGTGSSRKSATNSVLWHLGQDIPYVPNVRCGGVILGGKMAPIFFNTMEDSGALPIDELDVHELHMGDVIDLYPVAGVIKNHWSGETVTTFQLKTDTLLDEVRAGGRIPLIVGRGLTAKARMALGRDPNVSDVFQLPRSPEHKPQGWTLAQKIVGKACGLDGVAPGQYCEPHVATVGSQDTTGPMTRDELKQLACVSFSADLVMQSFCHTAAYPKLVDIETHKTLPAFFQSRGGVALRPGDGIIHSWINRMALPDEVGTGADSHTRFPIGISFPAGSGLVAFAAATGTMPLDMPESVLVRFSGEMQPGITLRDLVQSIAHIAHERGLLTKEKKQKKNIFSGRILEIEGLPHLSCEQAFELTNASAERSAFACTVKLDQQPVVDYVKSNVALLKWLISRGYGDTMTLERRIARMEEWLANPVLLEADSNAEYAAVLDINMDDIKEPVLACPNDPDASALLSEVAGTPVDEVFIGSCMTNIGHFRAVAVLLEKVKATVPTKLWLCPPTKMDKKQLREEGCYGAYCKAGARTETPGCSLCMGNQARVGARHTVVSTSTRNFPDRMGDNANVYLASAELAAIACIEGKLPTVETYMRYMEKIRENETDIYHYLQFDQMPEYAGAQAKGLHGAEEKKD